MPVLAVCVMDVESNKWFREHDEWVQQQIQNNVQNPEGENLEDWRVCLRCSEKPENQRGLGVRSCVTCCNMVDAVLHPERHFHMTSGEPRAPPLGDLRDEDDEPPALTNGHRAARTKMLKMASKYFNHVDVPEDSHQLHRA